MNRKGQHFLVDPGVIHRLADYADLSSRDYVLEIGPGTGNLTETLAAKAGRVYAIEVDPRLAGDLEGRFSNVIVVRGDALKAELPDYNKVVSNLPYQISTKITLRLLKRPFSLMVLMFQEEFARRMVAPPGGQGYGRLAINAARYANAEILEHVPKRAFRPQPQVRSAVVRLTPKPREPINDELFDRLSRDLFTLRRKKVGTALQRMGWSPSKLAEIEPSLLDRRPEELTAEDVLELAKALDDGGK
jgi:16S rRNA (adenine1518-N6/adenine1519-N6)-dimethyltransferase